MGTVVDLDSHPLRSGRLQRALNLPSRDRFAASVKAAGLRPGPRLKGRTFSLHESLQVALAAAVTRFLPWRDAADIVRWMPREVWVEIIGTDARRWFAALPDPTERAQFVVRVVDADELADLATIGGPDLPGLILVDLYAIARNVLAAALVTTPERESAA